MYLFPSPSRLSFYLQYNWLDFFLNFNVFGVDKIYFLADESKLILSIQYTTGAMLPATDIFRLRNANGKDTKVWKIMFEF